MKESKNFNKAFKKEINKHARMVLLYLLSLFSTVFIYIMYKIISIDMTTGLTDDSIDQLKTLLMESGTASILGTGIGMIIILTHRKRKLFSYDLVVEDKKMNWRSFIKIFLCFMSIQAITSVVSAGTEALLNSFGYTIMEQIESATSVSATVSMFMYASIIGPIAEEIVFRGVLLRGLEKYGKTFAIIISAIFFGAFHGNFLQGIFATIIGIVLAYVTIEYSIKWAMVIHVINNLVFGDVLGFILANFSTTSQEVFNITMLIVLFVGGAFVLFKNGNYIRKYIESNRSEKGLYKYTFTSFWVIIFLSVCFLVALSGIQKI